MVSAGEVIFRNVDDITAKNWKPQYNRQDYSDEASHAWLKKK